jgi:MATE family multidrug resistance protein
LIAEYAAAGVGFWLLRRQIAHAIGFSRWSDILSVKHLSALMHSNSNIFIRTLCLVFSFAFFTAQGAKLGEIILAANTILLQLHSIMAYGLDGFAHAAEALTGSAYGAKNEHRFRDAVRITTKWAASLALFLAIIYFALGTQILELFSNQQTILATAAVFLPWMIIAPIVSVWSFQFDGIFIGVGHTREMRNAMLVSTTGYLGLIWLLLPSMGNHGLFLALTLFMILRALTLWYYFPGISRSIHNQ